MELLNIRRAFEKAIKNLSPEIDTAFENAPFKPTEGKPYQKTQLNPFPVENPTYGDNYYRERGEFQVFLCYPSREGSAKAYEKAHAIRDYFFRGSLLVEGGTEITINTTPKIMGALIVDDRYVVPVMIEYFSSILKA